MAQFSEILLNWYDSHARELPWRQTSDPYLIWVSEIILQQTRVDQGLDYYLRFIKRFPNIKSLADADEDEVLRYWQGLGYYSRARNLHEAAKSMNNCFPTIYNNVLKLKGIGKYTAAAICSMAYGMPYAAIDGNVYRVLSRFFGIETPIDSTNGKKEFEELAQSLLCINNPGKYNQAIMDFGAIQCTPKSPKCNICPLSDSCLAKNNNKIESLPVKSKKTKVTERFFNYLYITDGDNIWLQKRTNNDIWKNLYELPLIETHEQVDVEHIITNDYFKDFTSEIKGDIVMHFSKRINHVLTHRIIHANFYRVEIEKGNRLPKTYIQIPIEDWNRYAMPQLIYNYLEDIK